MPTTMPRWHTVKLGRDQKGGPMRTLVEIGFGNSTRHSLVVGASPAACGRLLAGGQSPMSLADAKEERRMSTTVLRFAGFFAAWLTLGKNGPVDLLVGLGAAFAATWVSLRLLPPGAWRLRPLPLLRLAVRFLRQSIVGGVDVAWRALAPRMPLRVGTVAYPVALPAGLPRNAFNTWQASCPERCPADRTRTVLA